MSHGIFLSLVTQFISKVEIILDRTKHSTNAAIRQVCVCADNSHDGA